MRKRVGSGFTLIELLVVIVIIAILAAILFPIFMSAKESGRRTSCIGNIRQLSSALHIYADDQNGYYPPTRPTNWPWGDWDTRAPWGETLLGLRAVRKYVKSKAVFFCPSNEYFTKKHFNDFWNEAGKPGVLNFYCGYAYYGAYYAQDDSGITYLKEGQVAVNTGRFPQALLIADIIVSTPAAKTPVNSHTGAEIEGGNLCYNDGHAKWKRVKEMTPMFKRAGYQFYW